MGIMKFEISINAPKEKVWNALWEDANYRKWASVFSEGSHTVTDWKQGSKVLFLDGKGSGMISRVEENRHNEYMSFRHLGEIKNGVEDTTSKSAKQWADATESYTLTETPNGTNLTIDMEANMPTEFETYFLSTWPKALDKLKVIAESN